MKNVQGNRIGNVVNICIDGKLHKKNCGSPKEADELFRLILKAKANPSDDNLKVIRMYLNEKTRVAMMAGLESDTENGEVYLAGFNTPIPNQLVDVIREYHENGYPLDPIINFWKLLMINPDKRVRTSLFDFITAHDFVLTDMGYMVTYKAVYYANDDKRNATALDEFVTNQYFQKKKNKKSPKNYTVYKNHYGEYKTFNHNETIVSLNDYSIVNNLNTLYENVGTSDLFNDEDKSVYTDMHTRSMTIELGVPVKQARKDCDADPRKDCSNGLHVGATKYVEHFANNASVILACLVNPANVIAVPEYDHSKMRVCEYFPFAFASFENGKIDIAEQAYFEEDYCEYELDELDHQIRNVQKDELPIEKAINADDEERPMSELMKILETRLYVLAD